VEIPCSRGIGLTIRTTALPGFHPAPRCSVSTMADEHPALARFVDQAGSLYSLPVVAMEILELTGQPKVDLAALKTCLLRDPALVGKILRVVNSSMFGLSRGVSDLNQALALLGTKSVRLLVLGFSLPDVLFNGLAGETLRRYWHHTALKATAAREISESLYRLPGEEAFIAALLQDLGMLVLIQQLGEPYLRFLDRAFANAIDVHAAETVTLGFDHVQLSAELLKRWGLPENLVTAIGIGNSDERLAALPPAKRALPQILHLADLLAGMLTEGRGDWLSELLRVGQTYRQISGVQLNSLVEPLQEKVVQMAEALSLELPDGFDYRTIFAEAHRRLTSAADDAALELAVARRSGAVSGDDAEASLLDETQSLTEAVRAFSQAAQMGAGRVASTQRQIAATSLGDTATASKPVSRARSNPSANSVTATSLPSASAALASPSAVAANAAELEWIDPADSKLTGDDALLQRLTIEIAACRQARCPLSLIFIEVDRFTELLAKFGSREVQRLVQLVGLVCGQIDQPETTRLQMGANRMALVLPNCDRSSAVETAHAIISGVRRLNQRHAEVARSNLSVSIGVAAVPMPPKNFAAKSLIDSANRCLHAAQMPSGNAVKSIDVM
jgi:diguanylate cyclase (GGDEF)-like protein